MQNYTVLLENFEGPLDLLLQLVEREKLDIRDVAVSQVTQSYIAHMQSLKLNPEEVHHFLVVATQLLLTKSKRVLPAPAPADGDEELEDEADLAQRLQRYQHYRKLAAHLGQRIQSPFIMRPPKKPKLYAGNPLGFDISKNLLNEAWRMVGQRQADKKRAKHQVRLKPISLDAILADVIHKLQGARQLSLDSLLSLTKNPHEAVLSFLAVLELAKNNQARIEHTSDRVIMIYPGVAV